MEKESKDYLLGCCTSEDCTEFGGGWRYSIDFPKEDQNNCYCPVCCEELEFITQNDLDS